MWLLLVLTFMFSQASGKKPDKVSKKLTKPDKGAVTIVHTPDKGLAKARQESLQGNHGRVIVILRPLLYPTSKFSTVAKEIEALRLLGLSFWFKGDKPNAEQAFSVLLNRRPNFKLDPVVVPLGAIEFFKSIRQKLKEKLKEIRKAKRIEELKKKQAEEMARKRRLEEWKKNAPILMKSTVTKRNYFVYNLFPFGVGQFQNGDGVKGWLSAGFQAATAVVSLSTYTYLAYKYPKGTVPGDEVKSVKQIQYMQVGAGVTFFVLWFVSAVDAVVNFKPTSTEEVSKFVPRKGARLRLFASPLEGGGIFGISGDF